MTKPGSWQVDRNIPISLLFAMLVQTASIVWWTSDQTAINQAQAKDIIEISAKLDTASEIAHDRNIRITKLEMGIDSANKKIDEVLNILKTKVDKP